MPDVPLRDSSAAFIRRRATSCLRRLSDCAIYVVVIQFAGFVICAMASEPKSDVWTSTLRAFVWAESVLSSLVTLAAVIAVATAPCSWRRATVRLAVALASIAVVLLHVDYCSRAQRDIRSTEAAARSMRHRPSEVHAADPACVPAGASVPVSSRPTEPP